MFTPSPKQVAVCQLIAAGHPDKQIAGELGISVDLVRYHIRVLFARTGSRSRGELMLWFLLLSRTAFEAQQKFWI